MRQRSPAALWFVVALLIAAGAVLMYGLNGLTHDVAIPNAAAASPPPHPRNPGPSIDALRDAITKNDVAALHAQLSGGLNINNAYPLLESGHRKMTPLTFAAMQSGPDTVRALLAAGATPDTLSDGGWTPLMMAAARGDTATLSLLLNAGAPVEPADNWGETALIKAVRSGNADKVRALIEARAPIAAADNDGNTALHIASSAAAPAELVSLLLAAGAAPDTANKSGVTPLMKAADAGDPEKVQLLLNAGARPDLKDSEGNTALQWANLRADDPAKRCATLLTQAAK